MNHKRLKGLFLPIALLGLGVGALGTAVAFNINQTAPLTQVWADTAVSTLNFTAACGGTGTANDGAKWTVTSDGAESNFDSTCGIHYGTNKASVTYLQLSTSDISGPISQVVVNARDAQETATISVTVGGNAFTCSGSATATNSSANYTFTGSGSGEVVVRVDRGSSMTKAIYVKSIAVTYEAEPEEPKTVTGIAVKKGPTKSGYHSGDAFDATGLTITVTYDDESTEDITKGFDITPSSYTFTDADETAGSKTFTVSYEGKETTFSVNVASVFGPIASGRYYIMNSDMTRGLNAVAYIGSSPAAIDLSKSNSLTAFDVELKADNKYEITVTISSTKYYLLFNSTGTTAPSIRVTNSPDSNLASKYWVLDNSSVSTAGAYHVTHNNTGSTNRYLACYNESDWRGYVNTNNGDPEIQFVPEGSFTQSIVDAIMNTDSPLCDNGVNAPSTTVWASIATTTYIAHELEALSEATADEAGTDVQKAAARYDYIVGKYGKATYADFLSRNPSAPAGIGSVNFGGNTDTKTVVTFASILAVGLAAMGGMIFFARKSRKEN